MEYKISYKDSKQSNNKSIITGPTTPTTIKKKVEIYC